MVEFTPQGRGRNPIAEEHVGDLRRPYQKVSPEPQDSEVQPHVGAYSGDEEHVRASGRGDVAGAPRGFVAPGAEPARDARTRESRSLADLFRELANEGRTMVRQEAILAKAEVMQNVKSMARHAAMIAAGGAVAYAGFLAIVSALSLGLFVLMTWAGIGLGVSLWLGPLIVGIIVAIAGYAMLRSGLNRLQNDDLVPERTTETMRENAQWMQERMR
jgi:hypothetical protein